MRKLANNISHELGELTDKESILDAGAESLQGFVRENVAPGSVVVTDGWPSYVGLGRSGDYKHKAINLSASESEAHEELPPCTG